MCPSWGICISPNSLFERARSLYQSIAPNDHCKRCHREEPQRQTQFDELLTQHVVDLSYASVKLSFLTPEAQQQTAVLQNWHLPTRLSSIPSTIAQPSSTWINSTTITNHTFPPPSLTSTPSTAELTATTPSLSSSYQHQV